jgi:hypothetical protein
LTPWPETVTSLRVAVEQAPASIRAGREWRAAEDILRRWLERTPGKGDLEDATREAEAARDLLLLETERARVHQQEVERERERRSREDRQIVATLGEAVRRHGWLTLTSAVLVPVLGLLFGWVVLLAPAPFALGSAEVRRLREAADGRAWVLHRAEWDEHLDRARFQDLLGIAVVTVTVLWALFLLFWGDGP